MLLVLALGACTCTRNPDPPVNVVDAAPVLDAASALDASPLVNNLDPAVQKRISTSLKLLAQDPPSVEGFSSWLRILRDIPVSPERIAFIAEASQVLASWPDSMRFESISLKNPPKDTDVWSLVRHADILVDLYDKEWPPAANLDMFRHLTGINWGIFGPDVGKTAQFVEWMVTSLPWQNLEDLTFSADAVDFFDDACMRALVSGKSFPKLKKLSISRAELTNASAKLIATSPMFAQLEDLNLSDNHIGVEGVEFLASSENLKHLRSLSLSSNHVHLDGAKALANSTTLTSLKELYLGFDALGPEGMEVLASSTLFTNLHVLSVPYDYLGDRGVIALTKRKETMPLTHLELGYNEITDRGLLALAHSKVLPKNIELGLAFNPTGDGGEKAIQKVFPNATLARDPTDGVYTGEYTLMPPRGNRRMNLPDPRTKGLPTTVEFRRYMNVRFGFGVDVPSFFLPSRPPINGDGERFRWEHGARLIAAGIHSTLEEQFGYAINVEKGFSIREQKKTKTTFVVEAVSSERVVYTYAEEKGNRVVSVDFEYDRKLETYFRPLVARVATSLRLFDD